MRLVAEPLIPLALWLVLALAAAAALVWYAWTWRPLVGRRLKLQILALMAVAIALPLIVLLNLTWIERVPPPAGKPVIHVLLDRSASMAVKDIEGRSRFDEAQKIAAALEKDLANEFDVRFAAFDRALLTTDLNQLRNQLPEAQETNLAAALAGALSQDVPQGQSIVLLSDGIHNTSTAGDVLKDAQLAKTLDVPVYAKTLGGPVQLRNVAVTLRSPQELAFVGQKIPVVAVVETRGLSGQTIHISLCGDDQVLAEKEVVATDNRRTEVIFELGQDAAGLYRFEVRAGQIKDEATVDDNRSSLLLRVVDKPVKVLLVEGKPYWDTKFLVRKLTSDPSIELTSVVRMAEGRFLKRVVQSALKVSAASTSAASTSESNPSDVPPTPVSENTAPPTEGAAIAASADDLSKADQEPAAGQVVENTTIVREIGDVLSPESFQDLQVLILGRDAEIFLDSRTVSLIQNWISRDGGSLVCARGAPSSQINQQLGLMLPVKWNSAREARFRMQLTPQGRDLRWLAEFDSLNGDSLAAMPSLALSTRPVLRDGLTNVLAAGVEAAAGDETPAVSFQPYGTGRTVVVEGAGMWRWALLAPEYADREQVYGTLWRSLMRWLISRSGLLPGQNVALQPDKISFGTNEAAMATLLVRQEKGAEVPTIHLLGSDGDKKEFVARPVGQDPGVYRVDFGQTPAGRYRVEAIDQSGAVVAQSAFDAHDSWLEKLELDPRNDLMQRIAQDSGGKLLVSAAPTELAPIFRDHLEKSHAVQIRRVTVWDRWWILSGVFGVWAISWTIRRRSGLI